MTLDEVRQRLHDNATKHKQNGKGSSKCAECGRCYYEHVWLTWDDIADCKKLGVVVELCEEPWSAVDAFDKLAAIVILPPESPCDNTFMKEIST